MQSLAGLPFWKMTGSGNDFVFFDARDGYPVALLHPSTIGAICSRRTGIGADGIVLFEPASGHAYGIRYFNRDGSLAELCGNASLCSITLARELGVVSEGAAFTFETSSGALTGRALPSGPEFELGLLSDVTPDFETSLEKGELRAGYARVGVPHLVVLVDQLDTVDVMNRGRELRYTPSLKAGANANFVGRSNGGWAMRTYERGVEEETLACGSGAVATCAMLNAWGLADRSIGLLTSSGSPLTVTLGDSPTAPAALRGEGRLVYDGRLRDVGPAAN